MANIYQNFAHSLEKYWETPQENSANFQNPGFPLFCRDKIREKRPELWRIMGKMNESLLFTPQGCLVMFFLSCWPSKSHPYHHSKMQLQLRCCTSWFGTVFLRCAAMGSGKRPLCLNRAVQLTTQNYGVAAIVTLIFLLLFVPWWIQWVLLYIGGIVFLSTIIAPFIDDWRPRARVHLEEKAVFISGMLFFFYILLTKNNDLLPKWLKKK